MANKKSGEAFGISGFTLSISGFLVLVFNPFLGFIFFVAGMIFCAVQQKRKKTKLGKTGLIISVIGLIANIVYLIILIKYLIPLIQEQMENLPIA